MDGEVANVQAWSTMSTEPEFKQQGCTKKPRNKGVLYGWCCWYCINVTVFYATKNSPFITLVHGIWCMVHGQIYSS